MKKAYIERLLTPKIILSENIQKTIKENTHSPIFKTSEKSAFDAETGQNIKTTTLICSHCNCRFSSHENLVLHPVCPNCGNHGRYSSANYLTVADSFKFADNTKVQFLCGCENEVGLLHTDFIHHIASHDRDEYIHSLFLLEKETIDGNVFYVLRETELYYDIYKTTGKKCLDLFYTGNAMIFDGKEIVNIKQHKISTAMPSNTHYSYYCGQLRHLVADKDVVEDFIALLNGYPAIDPENMPIQSTNIEAFYCINVFALDKIVSYIKKNKPLSAVAMNRQKVIDEVFAKMPISTEFYRDCNMVYYTAIEVDEIAGTVKLRYTCPDCGSENIDKIPKYYSNTDKEKHHITCPCCGRVIELSDMSDLTNEHNSMQKVNVILDYDDGGVIVYDYFYRVLIEGNKKHFIAHDCYPSSIFVIKKEFNENSVMDNAIIIRCTGGDNFSLAKTICLDNHRDCAGVLHNIATNFNMQWSGIELWRNNLTVDMIAAYILIYRKYPVLEKITKAGYCAIVDDIVQTFDWGLSDTTVKYNLSQNDITSALRMSKGSLRIWNNIKDKSTYNFFNLQMLYNLDNNICDADYTYIREHGISPYKVADICRQFGLSVHDICAYLERVRISQCFCPSSAVSEWADYLVASEVIGCNLDDRKVKYPAALRTEHDKVMYKKQIIDNKDYEESFKRVTNKYGKRFSYKDKDFIITYPETLNDLFEEGRILHHCVGSYGDAVQSGKSIILFVRRAEEPSVPYFTIEVDPNYNAVTQFYGFSDKKPNGIKDKAVIAFVKKWASKNDINYR